MSEIILASNSVTRKNLLLNAGVPFRAVAAQIDERAVEQPLLSAGMHPADVAEVLAIAKADAVSEANPGAIVIGSDQTLSFEGELLHKAKDMDEARRRLLAFSGKSHDLHAAVVISVSGEIVWTHVETATLKCRNLSPAAIGRYLAAAGEEVLSSVGVYQIEGPGIQLFQSIKGDFFSILGLPLLPLLEKLRELSAIEN